MTGGKKVKGKRKRKHSTAVSSAKESKFLKEFNIEVDDISDISDAETSAVAPGALAVTKKKRTPSAQTEESESSAKKQKLEVEDEPDSDTESDSASNGIYIGGISYDASEEDLGAFFESCGKITSIRMPRCCLNSRMYLSYIFPSRYQDSGKPRGYAHIDFSSSKAVGKALELDGETMMGRYLSVSLANARNADSSVDRTRERPKDCDTVFVKNLPYDVDEDTVATAFAEFGEVASVRLSRWGHTGNLKGFGYAL